MEKLDGRSKDIEQTEREKLASVFPQCFVEGKLDIDKLLSLCGEYILKDFEKYEFTWKGKSECLPLAQQRSTATLRPCPEESVDFDTTQNLYIEGDNLEVLKLLQTSYFRQVKMIYIDPPYNTGHDFVYEDDFADTLARYKEVTSQTTKSNPEAMGRFHTNWLNMMYPRLRLAANLLRDDGAIFISIDDNEQENLKKLCNEVFGEENFVVQIVWEKKFSPQNDAKYFSQNHEYLLCYAKSLERFDRNLLPMTDDQIARYTNPDNDPNGPWTSSDLTRAEYRERDYYAVITPSGKQVFPAKGRSWNRPPQEIERLKTEGRLWFGENGDNVPRLKRYLSETKQGIVPISIWYNKDVGHTQSATQELIRLLDGKYFDFPKSVSLIKQCLMLATDKDDIVLDFFSGSATTAHAVLQLNKEDGGTRRFILVQLPELCDENGEAFKAGYKSISEIGKERIRRVGTQLQAGQQTKKITKQDAQLSLMDAVATSESFGDSHQLDTGFKVFKLDSSNLKIWDSAPFPEDDLLSISNRLHSMIDRVKSDRTDLDVVYEIMLKMGVPLTYNVSPVNISGKKAWSVGDFLLLICLSDGLTVEMVEEMAGYAPGQIVLAENSLADDTAMSNAYYILRDRNIELKLV